MYNIIYNISKSKTVKGTTNELSIPPACSATKEIRVFTKTKFELKNKTYLPFSVHSTMYCENSTAVSLSRFDSLSYYKKLGGKHGHIYES